MASPQSARLTLIIGGARSGKSRYAEALVAALPPPWTYVATAEAHDAEMTERIAQHAARRGAGWITREAPLDLAGTLADLGSGPAPVLVDCLTLWLSNVMLAGRDVEAESARLRDALGAMAGPVIVVSNEVGLGIVPDNALARAFRDAQGRLNAAVAAAAAHVVLMAAGLPLILKGPSRDTFSPPPPCGEGLGVGGTPTADVLESPPPNLPHKGGGTP